MSAAPSNKAERLAVAGAIAASVRVTGERDMSRRVALIDKDGNITGYTTVAEVKRSMLERAKIELDVSGSAKPKIAICKQCGAPAPISPRSRGSGSHPRFCQLCMRGRCTDCGVLRPGKNRKAKPMRCAACRTAAKLIKSRCADCETPIAKSAWYVAKKAGRPARCRPCASLVPRLKKPTCPRGHNLEDPLIGKPRRTGGRDCRLCARDSRRRRRESQRQSDPK